MGKSRMFWRLLGAFGTLLLGTIGLLGAVIVNRVERHYQLQIVEGLRTKAQLIHQALLHQPHDDQALQLSIEDLGRTSNSRITLLDASGQVLADSERSPAEMDNLANRPEVRAAREQGFGSTEWIRTALDPPFIFGALKTDAGQEKVAFVRVGIPVREIQEELSELRTLVWTATGLTSLAALVLASWLARRISQPVKELTESAKRIAHGDYGNKVYASGNDEVGTLARAFNHMSERLASQFAQLDEDRQQLRAILSGMVEGVIALDRDQRIMFVNNRAAQLLEIQAPAVVGRRIWEVFRHRPLQDVVRRALAEGEPCQEELHWNGAVSRNLTVHAAPLTSSPGRGAVLVVHDTSDLRRLERLRQDFVANVSHELKTPLSVIKACVETLQDGAKDDPQHRDIFLEQITDQSERLHALILDLLSLARIESGEDQFDFQTVDLEILVTECLGRHRARAESNRQVLEACAPSGDRVFAWADEEAIGQILENLVDNALKYTPTEGTIRVRWGLEGDQVRLEVEDTGIGIAERDLQRVFERFYRADKARSRQLGGTGLGLAIVKHLAQAMHGSARAASQLGKGSTFSVFIPQAPQPKREFERVAL
jgi:two-component system phosphate regulon sensor histidine kinase PhoR